MKELTNKELYLIQGGINWTASLFNGISKGINSILELGRSLGSSIRRIMMGNLC